MMNGDYNKEAQKRSSYWILRAQAADMLEDHAEVVRVFEQAKDYVPSPFNALREAFQNYTAKIAREYAERSHPIHSGAKMPFTPAKKSFSISVSSPEETRSVDAETTPEKQGDGVRYRSFTPTANALRSMINIQSPEEEEGDRVRDPIATPVSARLDRMLRLDDEDDSAVVMSIPEEHESDMNESLEATRPLRRNLMEALVNEDASEEDLTTTLEIDYDDIASFNTEDSDDEAVEETKTVSFETASEAAAKQNKEEGIQREESFDFDSNDSFNGPMDMMVMDENESDHHDEMEQEVFVSSGAATTDIVDMIMNEVNAMDEDGDIDLTTPLEEQFPVIELEMPSTPPEMTFTKTDFSASMFDTNKVKTSKPCPRAPSSTPVPASKGVSDWSSSDDDVEIQPLPKLNDVVRHMMQLKISDDKGKKETEEKKNEKSGPIGTHVMYEKHQTKECKLKELGSKKFLTPVRRSARIGPVDTHQDVGKLLEETNFCYVPNPVVDVLKDDHKVVAAIKSAKKPTNSAASFTAPKKVSTPKRQPAKQLFVKPAPLAKAVSKAHHCTGCKGTHSVTWHPSAAGPKSLCGKCFKKLGSGSQKVANVRSTTPFKKAAAPKFVPPVPSFAAPAPKKQQEKKEEVANTTPRRSSRLRTPKK